MAAILAMLAALGFGSSDFFGGMAARRVPVLTVALVAQAAAVGLVAIFVLLFAEAPTAPAIAWGLAGGVSAGIASTVYYRGLSIGQMGPVATAAAVWSAIVPVIAGIIMGERPSSLAWGGVALALIAIPLVSWHPASTPPHDPHMGHPPPDRRRAAGLLEGTIAGVFFGGLFIFLDLADHTGTGENPGSAGFWPVLAAATGGLIVIAIVFGALRPRVRGLARTWPAIVIAGACGGAGFVLFLLANREGLLSLAAVITALSPVPTAILARIFLREALGHIQTAGIALALGGVVLITLG